MPIEAEWHATDGVEAARALVRRLCGDETAQSISLALNNRLPGETYTVMDVAGTARVEGSSLSALATGINTWLHDVAHVTVTYAGDNLGRLPKNIPLPAHTLTGTASVHHRFALNDTDDAYTLPYRTWEEWEKLIDILAVHGINRVFVPVGAEAVYMSALEKCGYPRDALLSWIPQPDHQPWWLLQNMSGFPGPVSEEMVEIRAELGQKITRRLRELGMEPVVPGYAGMVPPGISDYVPGAHVIAQPTWADLSRPDWLDPTCPAFSHVARAFYEASREVFGDATYYKMDLLHEGGTAGNVPIGVAAGAVQDALEASRPGSTWVLLGWLKNPLPTLLAGIDRSRALIVDGLSDRYKDLDRNTTWPDTPYAFGSIWNFGGHSAIGANTDVWEERFHLWRTAPGSTCDGIAVLPEALNNNPAAFDRLTGLAWDATPANGPEASSQTRPAHIEATPEATRTPAADWFAGWASRRYMADDPAAVRAWRILGETAYAMPATGWSEAPDGLFAAEPSLQAATAAAWSPRETLYDTDAFAQALTALLDVAPDNRGCSAYRLDVADVARQTLSNLSRALLPRIKAAFDAGDIDTFRRCAERWLDAMALADEVAGTSRETMLGPWLAQARAAGHTKEESDRLERGCRRLVTIWGPRGCYNEGLADYANREWNGLISTYYAPRWKAYFDELTSALEQSRQPDSLDWYARGRQWVDSPLDLAMEPHGDVHEIATRIANFTKDVGSV